MKRPPGLAIDEVPAGWDPHRWLEELKRMRSMCTNEVNSRELDKRIAALSGNLKVLMEGEP